MNDDRRNTPPPHTQQLHQLPEADLDAFIKQERRTDEKTRLIEVYQQKITWRRTLMICILLNLFLITLGIIGLKS